jgi:integrase
MSTTDATPKRVKLCSLGYGQGSIWQRGDALYHVYFDGKQREVVLRAQTLTAARKEAAQRNVKREGGELPAPSRRTVGDVAAEFFSLQETLVLSRELRPRTLELYRQRWKSHLEERLSGKAIQKVNGTDVSAVLARMREKNLSPSVISGVLMIAGMIFTYAVERRYLSVSPMAQLSRRERPQAKPRTAPRVLSLAEIEQLLGKTPASIRDYLQFVAFTGCRMSEALAIRWQDIDLENGTAQISGQLERKTFRRIPTKTASGNREVFLTNELVTVLKARRVKALERGLHGPDQLVFCTKLGTPLSHRNVAREIRRAGDNAGLNPKGMQPISCHDLRHSFVSRLISNGIDPVTVAALAGDKVETILKVYAHEYDRARRSSDLRERVSAANIAV